MLGKRLTRLLRTTASDWIKHGMHQHGAALAYYGVFALAPTLLIAIAVAGLVFGEEAAQGRLAENLENVLGPTVSGAVASTLSHVYAAGSGRTASLVGVGILLFAATGLFVQLQFSLDTIWGVPPGAVGLIRGAVRSRVVAFLMVLSVGGLLLLSLVANVAVTALRAHLPDLKLASGFAFMDSGRDVLSFVLLATLFALVYRCLPAAAVAWRDAWVGGLVTAALFLAGNYVIGIYLTWSAPSLAFGPASYLIVAMIWVYYSSQVVLLGAVFTEVLGRRPPPSLAG